MRRLLGWFDKHFLQFGVAFLLLLIPLYPKLPLIEVEHTWVYIRLEDFAVALLTFFWLIQIRRKKLNFRVPLWSFIAFFWFVGGISLLFTFLVLRQHLANFFPQVAFLHYLRRIEYLVVFLIAASSIKSGKTLLIYLKTAVVALMGVSLYGFGQRFWGFPAFLTMNEEFAKGTPLYLASSSRLTSTFAGHYDLAAYLVLILPLFVGIFWGVKRWWVRGLLLLLVLLGYILLLLTASRVSFVVYLVAVSVVLGMQQKKRWIVPVIVTSLVLMNLVNGVSQRFDKTFRVERVVYDARTGKAIGKLEELPLPDELSTAVIPQEPEFEDLPLGSSYLNLPIIQNRAPESTSTALIKKTMMVDLKTASSAAEIATISGEFLIKRAIVYDISFTTRFQGTWQRALKAFRQSPILGTGYSSIGLASDNSYLRALGETGILGLLAFLSLLGAWWLLVSQGLKGIRPPLIRGFLIGISAGGLGLALNALLIDVFEASKVALSFWLLAGIAAGVIHCYLPVRPKLREEVYFLLKKPFFWLVIIILAWLVLFLPAAQNYFTGDDFTWIRWAAQSRFDDLWGYFVSSPGFFYRPLVKVYFWLVYPIFGLQPAGYHLVDFGLHLGVVIAAFYLAYLLTRQRFVAVSVAWLFLLSPANHEAVFWVASTSHLWASLFYFWGMIAYVRLSHVRSKKRFLFYPLVVLAFVFGLVSHELVLTFLAMIIAYDVVLGRFAWYKYGGWLVLAGAYLWLRNGVAQAHWLSGDYNYNRANFVFNWLGNLGGYLGVVLAGSRFIVWYDIGRDFGRSHKIWLGVIILILAVIFLRLIKKLFHNRILLFGLIWMIVLLSPFLGLGNLSERYVYGAQFGLFLFIARMLSFLNRKMAILIVFLLSCFYTRELIDRRGEWYQAGETANKILLTLPSNYISFEGPTYLHFVNVPLRYNRSWVFPVGLDDGLWFIYRNDEIQVFRDSDVELALDAVTGQVNSHVFVFEDNQLKEAKR
ncbi:MAG: O-antigen ligase family protein [Candidatus Shapirobacteria bacterium]